MAFGNTRRSLSFIALAFLVPLVVIVSLLWAAPVQAQIFQVTQQALPAPPVTETPSTRGVPAAMKQAKPVKQAKKFRLEKVLADMQRSEGEARQVGVLGSSGGDIFTGFTLIAESSVSQETVTPPAQATTAATLEVQLDALLKELPRGTRWVKLMMPPVPKGKTLHGDDLADFALAQARMYGSVGEAVLPKGSVEVLSQPLGSDKANAVIPALNLHPIYLLVNPEAHYAMVRGGGQPGISLPVIYSLYSTLSNGSYDSVPLFPMQRSDPNPNASNEWNTLYRFYIAPQAPSTPSTESGSGAVKP